ncbi:GTP-binding protein, putative [Plasmodium sp. gorilla clade G2]|uniref:GTP-binding protein, putative n=1 Tax=Plasmodium sp. gorilla clade G2 TaxID=880535 RepID=UPI000D20B0F2|nr:GTP-binding protein, putative [Plasmodium sp. gorilla clade G2]SOV15481.1 GTP-binding protein, putative [Plasmodium sp. gorilla clade G2]
MRRILFLLKNVNKIEKRYFTDKSNIYYHNESPKKEIIVLHPILKRSKNNSNKLFQEIIYDAQEALGLAKSANFKIAKGISMPLGGWYLKNEKKEKEEDQKKDKIDETQVPNKELSQNNEQHHVFEKSEKEILKKLSFTNDKSSSKYINYDEIEHKIAESILIKVNNIDNKFYFSKGKLNELSKYYLKNPTPCIFINTLLSPEQFRNLEFLFNSLLKSYQDELILNNKRECDNTDMYARMSDVNFDNCDNENIIIDNSSYCLDAYNNFLDKEDEQCDDVNIEQNMNILKEDIADRSYEQISDRSDEQINDMPYEQISDTQECSKNIPMYVELFDRYSIILYILKSRAKNNLSKLQLELARANFVLNTYSEDSKSRMKYIKYIENNVLGGSSIDYEEKYTKLNFFTIGKQNKKSNANFSGYTSNYIKSNETYKEYEKRIINNLYSKLKKELIKCKNNMILQNNSRKHKALIAIVGYTNVGKTKLINYLTKSNLKARNLLFQTLDNAYKNLNISTCYSTIFVDSIGFIQNIPYSLYESFKISLEAIKTADVIIHVIDVSHPYKDNHKKCVLETLNKIGISDEFIKNNVIEVWNKIDKLTDNELYTLCKNKPKNALPISAKYGTNCNYLIQIIEHLINQIKDVHILNLQFPTSEAKDRIDFLIKNYKVVPHSISYSDDGNTTFIKLVENKSNLKKYYEKFENNETSKGGN